MCESEEEGERERGHSCDLVKRSAACHFLLERRWRRTHTHKEQKICHLLNCTSWGAFWLPQAPRYEEISLLLLFGFINSSLFTAQQQLVMYSQSSAVVQLQHQAVRLVLFVTVYWSMSTEEYNCQSIVIPSFWHPLIYLPILSVIVCKCVVVYHNYWAECQDF